MDFNVNDVMKKLDDLDQKYSDSSNLSQKALKELGEQQLKYAQDLAKVQAEVLAIQKKNEEYPEQAEAAKSIGERFINTKSFGAFAKDVRAGIKVRETFSTKAATTSTTSTGVTDNFLGGMGSIPGVIAAPQRRLIVESLFPHIPVSTGAMDMVKETSFTNNAAAVAEAASKPESTFEFEKYNVSLETVAHWTKISEQLAADAPAVAAFINARMQYGLQNKIDAQLITGTGSSGQISGLLKSGNYTDYSSNITVETNDTLIDFAAKIMAELEALAYVPEYIVLNPKDWTALTLLKDGQKRYILGGPGSASEKSLWGVPVRTTSAMTQGKYIIADFNLGAAVLDRQELTVDIDRTGDDFTKNLLTIRCERRLALAVLDAAAIAGGDWSLGS